MRHQYAIRTIRSIFAILAALLLFSWSANIAAADTIAQVSIAGNGQTMIKNAEVKSISGNSLVISLLWGATRLEWRVETTGSTTFYPRMESGEFVKHIAVGDIVSITGTLDREATKPTVLANVLRDLSLENNAAEVTGTILDIDPRSASISADTETGPITITIGSHTVITREGNPIGLSRLEKGEQIHTSGSLNLMTSTMRAVKVTSSGSPKQAEGQEDHEDSGAVTTVPATPSFFMRLMSWVYGSAGQISIR